MNITVRMATMQDAPLLVPLLRELGHVATVEDLEKRIEQYNNFEGYGVAVAIYEKKLVGFIAWSKTNVFVSNKTKIHGEALVVDKAYRRKSIGKQLMQFFEDFSRKFSPVVIDLFSSIDRADEAHKLYKALGYSNGGPRAMISFRKILN